MVPSSHINPERLTIDNPRVAGPGIGESDEESVVSLEAINVIDRSSPIPYYFQLSKYIEKKIEAREWMPGKLLPSEAEFCRLLGISRTVVRQALSELERRGFITKRNGKRTTVAFPRYEGGLMQNLRGFYEDAVAKGQKPSTKVLEFKIVPAQLEVAEALQIAESGPVIKLNRLRFLDGEPEVLVVTYLPAERCPGLIEENLSEQSLYEVLARKYGYHIAQGYRSIEAIALNSGDARVLNVRPGSPALLLKSIGLLEDGTALEFFIAKHRGDRSRFQVRLVRTPG